MEKDNFIYDMKTLRSKVVNYALVSFTFLGTLVVLAVFFNSYRYGFTNSFDLIIQISSMIILIISSYFRKHLSIGFKIVIMTFVLVSISIVNFYVFGIFSNMKIFIVVFPIFLSFVLPLKKALFALIFLILVYCIYAYFFTKGILVYSFNINLWATNTGVWITGIVVIITASVGLLLVGHFFNEALRKNFVLLKKQNIELTNNEEKYRLLFESSNDGIILIKDNCYTDCNNMTLKLFKCERSYIIDNEPWKFSPEFQPNGQNSKLKAEAILTKVLLGEPQIFDWQHIRPNGEVFDVSVSLNLLVLDNVKYIQAVLRDVTEKKLLDIELEKHRNNLEKLVVERTNDLDAAFEELMATNEVLYEKNKIINDQNFELKSTMEHLKETQSNLVQAEKMASLGVLTAGVAHEINNPLNFIMGGYMGLENYFIETGGDKDKQIQIFLNSIQTGIERASEIVNGLNQFSRNNGTHTEDCDIHLIINNCLLMLNNQLVNKIIINKVFTNGTFHVSGNIGKLHQVFLNILSNSIQSIDKIGSISISTYNEPNSIVIEISDTGCGIGKENLAKITDPFFTTKDPGKGTGLGLSIAYQIIQDHHGTINFQSELNKGTSVKIILPLTL